MGAVYALLPRWFARSCRWPPMRLARLFPGIVWITLWWWARSGRERQCALVRVIRLRLRIGSVAAYPRSLGKCDRSVHGRCGSHQRGRPERYACEALPSNVAAGNAFHGYPENHIMQVDAQPSGRTFPARPGRRCENLPSAARNDYRVGSSAGCRVGSPATVSSSRTRAITRRVSSVIRTAASRCSAPSAGSMPRSCASASRAASGLFSWCWIRTIAFRTSLGTVAGVVSAGVIFVAAPSRISGEDDRIDCSVTTDAARVSTIV